MLVDVVYAADNRDTGTTWNKNAGLQQSAAHKNHPPLEDAGVLCLRGCAVIGGERLI